MRICICVLQKKKMLNCRDKGDKKGERDNSTISPFFDRIFPFPILRISSLNHSICLVSSSISLRLPKAPVRVGRTHARTLGNDEDGPSRRVGRPSWLMSSRAPSTQPRNANFLVASGLLLFKFFLFSYFTLFSLLYFPSSAPSAERERERELVSSFLSFLTLRTRIVDDSRVQTFAFRLRNEARHPLPGTCKMAEFNGKASIRAIRCWDFGTERGGPLILITLISLPLL